VDELHGLFGVDAVEGGGCALLGLPLHHCKGHPRGVLMPNNPHAHAHPVGSNHSAKCLALPPLLVKGCVVPSSCALQRAACILWIECARMYTHKGASNPYIVLCSTSRYCFAFQTWQTVLMVKAGCSAMQPSLLSCRSCRLQHPWYGRLQPLIGAPNPRSTPPQLPLHCLQMRLMPSHQSARLRSGRWSAALWPRWVLG